MTSDHDDPACAAPVPEPDGATEVIAWAEDGRLLLAGEPTAIDAFVSSFEGRQLEAPRVGVLADGLAVLTSILGIAGAKAQGLQLDLESRRLVAEHGAQIAADGTLQGFVRDSAGRFAGGLKFEPTTLANGGLPTLQTAAIALALRVAVAECKAAVEDIAAEVDDLRAHTDATELGNTVGLYRILANARAQVDETGVLSQATWDSVAAHEVTAQQGADRARARIRHLIRDLPLGQDTGTRTEAATQLVQRQTLSRCLQLLLVSEQTRLLYRSLKLDHTRRTEPEFLQSETEAARSLFHENAHADLELIETLHEAITELGKERTFDGLRFHDRHHLPRAVTALRHTVDDFAQQRNQQIDTWVPSATPRIRDTVQAVTKRARQTATHTRHAVGSVLENLGQRMQTKPSSDTKSTQTEHETTDEY